MVRPTKPHHLFEPSLTDTTMPSSMVTFESFTICPLRLKWKSCGCADAPTSDLLDLFKTDPERTIRSVEIGAHSLTIYRFDTHSFFELTNEKNYLLFHDPGEIPGFVEALKHFDQRTVIEFTNVD